MKPNWKDASCKNHHPEMWFPDSGFPERESTREAKRICALCPQRKECLEYALNHRIQDGIWGGLSPKERLNLRKKAGTSGKPVQPCGTRGAYQRHHRNGEKPCAACKQAARDYENRKYATSLAYRLDRKTRRKERTWRKNKCQNISPLFDV